MSASVPAIIRDLEHQHQASSEELAVLLAAGKDDALALFAAADRVRAAAVGDEVHLRGLIEFSNHCRRNCLYCGLRRDHRSLSRYRMTPEEILDSARTAADLGYRTLVLQSGEDLSYTAPALADLIRRLKAECDMAVTLSIGERTEADYRLLREAGADRFLLRIETSSPALYRELHPDPPAGRQGDPDGGRESTGWYHRLSCLHVLRRLGYQVGSGVMIGLPGQSLAMLAEDLIFLQGLDLDMIGVGPFIPHPATPLAGPVGGSLALALRFLACLRLLCPTALLPATSSLEALHPAGRRLGLQAGADVIMPNATPPVYRKRYQLYPGKVGLEEDPAECRRLAEELVVSLGRRVACGRGHSRRPPQPPPAGRRPDAQCPAVAR